MLALSFQARENTPQCTPRPMVVKVKQLRLPKLWCAYRGPRGAHWYETEVYRDRMPSMDNHKSATETLSGRADNEPATAYKPSEVVCAIFVHEGMGGKSSWNDAVGARGQGRRANFRNAHRHGRVPSSAAAGPSKSTTTMRGKGH